MTDASLAPLSRPSLREYCALPYAARSVSVEGLKLLDEYLASHKITPVCANTIASLAHPGSTICLTTGNPIFANAEGISPTFFAMRVFAPELEPPPVPKRPKKSEVSHPPQVIKFAPIGLACSPAAACALGHFAGLSSLDFEILVENTARFYEVSDVAGFTKQILSIVENVLSGAPNHIKVTPAMLAKADYMKQADRILEKCTSSSPSRSKKKEEAPVTEPSPPKPKRVRTPKRKSEELEAPPIEDLVVKALESPPKAKRQRKSKSGGSSNENAASQSQ